MKEKVIRKIKKLILFFLNPRLLLCVGIGWMITNGWSYVMFGFGMYFEIEWMIAASSAYLSFLWFPFSPEKIATAAIAIALLKWLFPNDEKTLAVLSQMYHNAKKALKRKKKNDDSAGTD